MKTIHVSSFFFVKVLTWCWSYNWNGADEACGIRWRDWESYKKRKTIVWQSKYYKVFDKLTWHIINDFLELKNVKLHVWERKWRKGTWFKKWDCLSQNCSRTGVHFWPALKAFLLHGERTIVLQISIDYNFRCIFPNPLSLHIESHLQESSSSGRW